MGEPGVMPEDLIRERLPPDDAAMVHPVAVIECPEEIPCDTCRWVCPTGAVVKASITTPPRVDWARCTGCGTCLLSCPGLAIFMVRFRGDWADVYVPYEFNPLPRRGEEVSALDRVGRVVARAEVVLAVRSRDGTGMVAVRVPRELAHRVRAVRVEGEGA